MQYSTLKDLRRKRGLTLEAVGYIAGVDQATISRLERGLVRPHPQTIVQLARGLGISIARLEQMVEAARGNDEPLIPETSTITHCARGGA